MRTQVSKNAIQRAQKLRGAMGEIEWRLWNELKYFRRTCGHAVRRQVPFGPYIADFAIHSSKLIIEVGGEHHNSSKQQIHDAKRDKWFLKAGYRTLRFTTGEIYQNLDGCIDHLLNLLEEKSKT